MVTLLKSHHIQFRTDCLCTPPAGCYVCLQLLFVLHYYELIWEVHNTRSNINNAVLFGQVKTTRSLYTIYVNCNQSKDDHFGNLASPLHLFHYPTVKTRQNLTLKTMDGVPSLFLPYLFKTSNSYFSHRIKVNDRDKQKIRNLKNLYFWSCPWRRSLPHVTSTKKWKLAIY